ncbi:cold shock domain-containing protein [Mycolicibacterium arabiense]|nr:cold shock domain-containing protein [Mycolicibacterium arabiense]MCV7371972.1 cold shock domain-containing protein [Mycolicibacterium arabiense]
MRLTGRIVRFDTVRGYGFITPDSGGDDVFLHANDLEMEKSSARPGARVSFDVEDGERGQFATSVRPRGGASVNQTGGQMESDGGESSPGDYVEVLSATEFEHVVTELLLTVTPPLNAPQIVAVRAALMELAGHQNWLE